jgi:hypothetical protein
MTRRAVVVAATVAAVLAGGVAWATNLTVTSQKLGGAALTVPVFFPDSVATVNNGNFAGRPQKTDTITVTFNKVILLSTVCAGAPQSSSSASGFLFTLTDGGGAVNDSLSIGGGTSCPALHFGSFTLGSPSYVSGTAITFPSSTLAITLAASTTTVVLTFGTASANPTTVSTATIVKYTPDAAMTDTAAHGVGTNTASTASAVQF